jgi:hypothetical protein
MAGLIRAIPLGFLFQDVAERERERERGVSEKEWD